MTKRRGRGEGSIHFLVSKALWCAQLTIGYNEEGTRKRRYVYGKTKKEVQNKLIEMQSASASGTLAEPKQMRLADYLAHWLEDTARPSVRLSTFVSYRWILRKYVTPHLGGLQLAKLQPIQIQNLYTVLENAGASPRMRQMVHMVLRRALSQAVQWGHLQRNPCEGVKRPRAPRKSMNCFTKEQINQFLKAAQEDRLYALYLLALCTGLRQGELIGLKWSDVDLSSGSISVQRTVHELSGKLCINEPKTSKGRRQVTIPDIAIIALLKHRDDMLKEKNDVEWVFCDTSGKIVRATNMRHRSFYPLLIKAGVPKIRFHDLRHTAATILLSQGVHPKIVQERLGHAQIAITLDTYSHVLPTMQKDAAEKVNEYLSSSLGQL